MFVYKSSEGALADDHIKVVDGIQLQCKLAIDGKKGKPLGQDVAAGPGPMGGGYGVPGAGSGPYRMPPRSMFAWSLRFDVFFSGFSIDFFAFVGEYLGKFRLKYLFFLGTSALAFHY